MTFKVFGYGSLVNRGTLPPHIETEKASVRGWRRAWRATSVGANGGVCSLSVVPDPDTTIEGLVVTFDDVVWPIIRRREHNYDYLPLEDHEDVLIFRAKEGIDRFGDARHPIFMSYLETTLQGFLTEFGPDGAARFMATTEGWHVPILNDREVPNYPRAQLLSSAEQIKVDELLETVDARPLLAAQSRGA